jgi:hypothetical protein
LNSHADEFGIAGGYGDIADGNDSDQASLPIHYGEATDFMILHNFPGVIDILIFKAENNVRRHYVLASNQFRVKFIRRRSNDDVTVRNHAHELSSIADREDANVMVSHPCGSIGR